MSSIFSLEHAQLPVTALGFCSDLDLVLAAQGSHLLLYAFPDRACIWNQSLFDAQTIHGITVRRVARAPARYIILVWGGKTIRCLVLDACNLSHSQRKPDVTLGDISECDDWIINCSFQPSDLEDAALLFRAAVITAHNELVLLESSFADSPARNSYPCPRIVQTTLSAATQSILYSADIRWISSTHILVAGGSPFGTIIVWSLHIQNQNHATSALHPFEVHHTFTAHPDSAVFGIKIIESKSHTDDTPGSLVLASCSDDRMIQVWHFSSFTFKSVHSRNIYEINSAANIQEPAHLIKRTVSTDEATEPLCVAKVNPGGPQSSFGHSSRIWVVDCLSVVSQKDVSSLLPVLLSLGEDATAQIWQLEVKSSVARGPLAGEINHVATYNRHSGKNIWSFTQIPLAGQNSFVALGGADGAITLNSLNLEQVVKPKRELNSLAEPMNVRSEVKTQDPAARDWSKILKTYGFLSVNCILATTTEGHVLFGEFSENMQCIDKPQNSSRRYFGFRCIDEIDELKNYSTIATLSVYNIGFVAGAEGNIYSVVDNHVDREPIGRVDGKISRLFTQILGLDCSTTHKSSNGNQIALLAARPGGKPQRFWIFEHPTYATAPNSSHSRTKEKLCNEKCFLDVPTNESHVTTSMLCVRIHNTKLLLFIGSRAGSVSKHLICQLYDDKSDQASGLSLELDLDGSQSVAHHSDAITMMKWKMGIADGNQPTYGFLLSTGRDSTYSIHRYTLNDAKAVPHLVHRLELPFGPNIEGMFFSGPEESLFLYGFRSEDFIIYNHSHQKEMLRVHCAGAHRVWDFRPPLTSSENASFAWTRASKLYGYTSTISETSWLRPGGHGREIKACAACPRSGLGRHDSSVLLATGAEDTDIRLSKYECAAEDNAEGVLATCHILKKHATGLQHLQWSDDGKLLFSSGSREEFFVWRINSTPFLSVGVVLESKLPLIGDLSDLRIMGFDVLTLQETGKLEASETEQSFVITMVLSNSTTRVYKYTSGQAQPEWKLIGKGIFNAACVTHIQHVCDFSKEHGLRYLTGATDGSLALWTVDQMQFASITSNQLTPAFSIRIFQNTVKCFTVIQPKQAGDEILAVIIACGDDNSLGITIMGQEESEQENGDSMDRRYYSHTLILPRAHAASINALVAWLIPNSTDQLSQNGNTRVRVATASNDQKLKIWDVSIDLGKPGIDGISIKKAATLFSDVADASSLAVLDEKRLDDETYVRIALCGVGIEMWRIPKSKSRFDLFTRA